MAKKTVKPRNDVVISDVPTEYAAGLYVHHIPLPPSGEIIPDPYEEAAKAGLTEEKYEELSHEDMGCTFNIWLPTPESICLIWNIKRVKEVFDFATENAKEMPASVKTAWQKTKKRGQYFFSLLSLPWAVRKFYADDLKKRWNMKFVPQELIEGYYTVCNWVYQTKKMWNQRGTDQKPNKLGLPGGKITRWEEHYAGACAVVRATAREFLEEGKRHPTKLAFSSRMPDFKPDTFKNFFWVIETHGEWKPDPNNTGVEGETLPPREILFAELPEKYFYYSHAVGIIALLRQLVEGGLSEYQESLGIMEKKFPPSPRFATPRKSLPKTTTTTSYDENVDFAEQMRREGVAQL